MVNSFQPECLSTILLFVFVFVAWDLPTEGIFIGEIWWNNAAIIGNNENRI